MNRISVAVGLAAVLVLARSDIEIPQHRYNNDVGITATVTPGDTVEPGTEVTPQVAVRSYAEDTQRRAVRFIVMVDSAAVYADQVSIEVEPDDVLDISFPSWQVELYRDLVFAFVLNPHDVNPRNDSAAVRVVVREPGRAQD